MSMAVSSFRYQSKRSDQRLRERLLQLAREKPRYGYRRLQVLVERDGERVNHKRLYRVYRAAGLCLRRKKRKHCVRSGLPLSQTTASNQEWALDFAHDVIAAGRVIRVLSVVDTHTRECFALEVDTGFASRRVTRVLDEVIARRGKPLGIRCDDGPELTSRHMLAWIGNNGPGADDSVRFPKCGRSSYSSMQSAAFSYSQYMIDNVGCPASVRLPWWDFPQMVQCGFPVAILRYCACLFFSALESGIAGAINLS